MSSSKDISWSLYAALYYLRRTTWELRAPQTPTRFPVATARNVARCLPYPGEIQPQLPKIQGHRGEQAVVPCQPAASSLIGAVDALFPPELRILKYSKAIQSRTESARILLADAVVSCARLGRRSNLVNVKISTSQLIWTSRARRITSETAYL